MNAPQLAALVADLLNRANPEQTTLDDYYRDSAAWRQQCQVARLDVAAQSVGRGTPCACGCGQTVTRWSASPDFADAACQQRWYERRRRASTPSTGEDPQ